MCIKGSPSKGGENFFYVVSHSSPELKLTTTPNACLPVGRGGFFLFTSYFLLLPTCSLIFRSSSLLSLYFCLKLLLPSPHSSLLIPHSSHLLPLCPVLLPHTSLLIPHASRLTPSSTVPCALSFFLTPHSSYLTPHSSHLLPLCPAP